jgi:phosphate transport system substrate-binding protein
MKTLFSLCLAVFAFVLGGCNNASSGSSGSTAATSPGTGASVPAATGGGDGSVSLTGQGATFPAPLYAKWTQEYQNVDKTVKLNYQATGSGAGIRAITDKTADFGASDAAMTDDQLKNAKGTILHIPMALGAVVVTYNVTGSPKIQLTPDVLAAIFTGDIKKWNDPKIAALNAAAKLPDQPIGVSYRSDGSGTTAVFTSYLSKVSPAWSKIGSGTTVKWPVGSGAKGNDGVTAQVKSTPGAIGYVELVYAMNNKLPMASLKNHSGKFVDATLDSITAAGASAQIPDDLRISILDADGDAVYPISAYTYILVYQDMPDATKGRALAKFLSWGIHDGQKLAGPLYYAPLPDAVVQKAEAKIESLTSGGKPLLK